MQCGFLQSMIAWQKIGLWQNKSILPDKIYQFTIRTFVRIMLVGGDSVVGKCDLASDINKCPYFIVDKEGCNNTDKVCGFYRNMEDENKTPYTKEVKWFEKYYK
jgi:hypothetical protein